MKNEGKESTKKSTTQKLRIAKSARLMRANTYIVFMLIAVIAVLSSVVVWQLWAR